MKNILILFAVFIAASSFAADFGKYFIPYPKIKKLSSDNGQVLYSEAKADNLLPFVAGLCKIDLTGEIESVTLLYDIKPIKFDIDSVNPKNEALHGIHLGIVRLNVKDKATENMPSDIKSELKPLIETHHNLWSVRNRKGGLEESAGKQEKLLNYC